MNPTLHYLSANAPTASDVNFVQVGEKQFSGSRVAGQILNQNMHAIQGIGQWIYTISLNAHQIDFPAAIDNISSNA